MLERLPSPSEGVHVSSPLVVAGCSLEGPGGGEAGVPDGQGEDCPVCARHRMSPVDGGWQGQKALESGLGQKIPACTHYVPPIGKALNAGEPVHGPWWTGQHGDAVQEPGLDHYNMEIGHCFPCKYLQEVRGTIDGSTANTQGGLRSSVRVYCGGPLWITNIPGPLL